MVLNFKLPMIFSLLIIHFACMGQFDDIDVNVSFGEEHYDYLDSTTTYKEIDVEIIGMDSIEFNSAHIDLISFDEESLIARKDFIVSDSLNPHFSVSNTSIDLTISYFIPTESYKLVIRLTNYQGIESELINAELLKEE